MISIHDVLNYLAKVFDGLTNIKSGSIVDKEGTNNIIFCNRTWEEFHGSPEIHKLPLHKKFAESPLNKLNKSLTYESSNEHEQCYQQDIGIHRNIN